MSNVISLEDYKKARLAANKNDHKLKNALRDSLFLAQLNSSKLPAPQREYKFHEVRKWRFDFAWPDQLLAVEIEGGSWVQGRHTRPVGFLKDIEKYNSATLEGWRLLRVTPKMIEDGSAAQLVKEMLRTWSR